MIIQIGPAYYMYFDPKLWEARQPYPPLGTLYAASVLRQSGHLPILFDATLARSEKEWEDKLAQSRPDLAVIYEDNFNYLSKMCLLRMRHAALNMIEAARRRNIPVVVSGSDAADHAETYLSHGADYVIIGEGEQTLAELVNLIESGREEEAAEVDGLAYLNNGVVFKTRPRQNIRKPDTLPFPARDLADMDHYRDIWISNHGYFSLNMVTARGCPFHCNWCAKPIWGQRYHTRSPKNVVEEMEQIKNDFAPDYLWFMDDIMGMKPSWLVEFAGLIRKKEINIPFKCLNRPDLLLREGIVNSLARAGCDMVWIGAESGSQKILDAMEKGTRVDQIDEATRLLRDHGIKTGYFLQYGYPGETTEDIALTLEMIRRNQPDDIGISVSYPLPGTKFYDSINEQLGSKQNWYDSNDMAMMYEGPYSTPFYRKLHTITHNEFYLISKRDEVVQSLTRPRLSNWRSIAGYLKRKLLLPLQWRQLRRLSGNPANTFTPPDNRLSRQQAATPTH